MKSDRKIVWVYIVLMLNVLLDWYRNISKTLKLQTELLLQSLRKPNQWYAAQVVGQNALGKVMKSMLDDARIDGYISSDVQIWLRLNV